MNQSSLCITFKPLLNNMFENLAANGACHIFRVETLEIKSACQQFSLRHQGKLTVLNTGDVIIINDAYLQVEITRETLQDLATLNSACVNESQTQEKAPLPQLTPIDIIDELLDNYEQTFAKNAYDSTKENAITYYPSPSLPNNELYQISAWQSFKKKLFS